jgi:hypothetical protein
MSINENKILPVVIHVLHASITVMGFNATFSNISAI